MRVFVVVDIDNAKALRAFVSETKADDWAMEYYEQNGIDTRVDEVYLDQEVEEED